MKSPPCSMNRHLKCDLVYRDGRSVPAFRFLYSPVLTTITMGVFAGIILGLSSAVWYLLRIPANEWAGIFPGAKLTIVGVVLLMIGVILFSSGRQLIFGRPGISLLASGIYWEQSFETACLIPWERIETVGTFRTLPVNHENRGGNLAIGLRVREYPFDRTESDPLLRYWRSFLAVRATQGYDLLFLQESLGTPVDTIDHAIRHYLTNPERWGGIGTEEEFAALRAEIYRFRQTGE